MAAVESLLMQNVDEIVIDGKFFVAFFCENNAKHVRRDNRNGIRQWIVATWQSSTEETELGNRQGIILLLVQLLMLVEGYEATLRETIGNLE